MKVAIHAAAALLLVSSAAAAAQDTPVEPTSLQALLAEAHANNSQIGAAEHAWRAATHVAPQVKTLPDPKLTVQEFSVGSPRPFAGYTNSNFAYIGVGGSQELPFPGKLRLRGEVADQQAETLHAQVAVTDASVADGVKSDYIQLAYLQGTLGILNDSKTSLDTLIKDTTLHYEVGQGMQQDVLAAQIERTKIVRELAMHHGQMAELQAHLKGLLHRDQRSPDIVTEPLRETALTINAADLLAMVQTHNPQVNATAHDITVQQAKLDSAKREGKPDFELGYMYQNTDRKYRDYYMLTLNVRLPRKARVNAEVAAASESVAQAKDALDAQLQQEFADVQQQYARAASDTEVLTDEREGLIPQSEAAYRTTLSSYGAKREQFAHVISGFLALLNLRLEYLQTMADHEIALARLETLTGASLR